MRKEVNGVVPRLRATSRVAEMSTTLDAHAYSGDDNTQILFAVALMLVADARAWMPLSGAALPAMITPIRACHASARPCIIMQARLGVLCVHVHQITSVCPSSFFLAYSELLLIEEPCALLLREC